MKLRQRVFLSILTIVLVLFVGILFITAPVERNLEQEPNPFRRAGGALPKTIDVPLTDSKDVDYRGRDQGDDTKTSKIGANIRKDRREPGKHRQSGEHAQANGGEDTKYHPTMLTDQVIPHFGDHPQNQRTLIPMKRPHRPSKMLFDLSTDYLITTPEQFRRNALMKGAFFDSNGFKEEFGATVQTALVHSFSPQTEARMKEIFLDLPSENVFYANSPAMYWDRDRLVVVLRIWLDKERYEAKGDWPRMKFADNYLFTQTFSRNMTPITTGRILGIPTSAAFIIGDGPIEPRIFPFREKLYVSFNTGVVGEGNRNVDYTMMWDLEDEKVFYPRIEGGNPIFNSNTDRNDIPRDKHWMPVNDGKKLFFVHSLEPLRVLECNTTFNCKFNQWSADQTEDKPYNDYKSHVRGGTPFVQYKGSYYIGLSHVTLFRKVAITRRYYTTHLVVLKKTNNKDNPFKVVYFSHDIPVSSHILESVPIVRSEFIGDPFIFPVGLIIENPNSMLIGVHVNDYSAVILRFKGLLKIMSTIERIEEELLKKADTEPHGKGTVNPFIGPPVPSLNEYSLKANMKKSGYKFFTS